MELISRDKVAVTNKSNNQGPDLVGLSDRVEHAIILQLLITTLYDKLETIIYSHSFILDFVNMISNSGVGLLY